MHTDALYQISESWAWMVPEKNVTELSLYTHTQCKNGSVQNLIPLFSVLEHALVRTVLFLYWCILEK